MAQETGTATGTGSGAKDQRQHDHIDEDEVSELQKSRSFYDRVREQAERFASTRMGQFVIERADRALVMIEDTAKWSLPQEKSAAPLARPLPWGPFLMLIILLRLTRIWLSVGALLIGNGPISPSDMVYFIQTRRRKLRAIRVHGLKVMRQRQQEVSYGSSSASGRGLSHKLTEWVSKAMCRPGVQRANSGRLFAVRNTEQTTQTTPAVMKRPREEDSNADADHNLTIDQMLAKYANENSEDDSDFVPNAEEEDTSGSSSESSEESSDEISSGEAEEVLSQAKPKPMENGVHKAPEKENDKEKAKGKAHLTTSSSNGDKDTEQVSAAEVGAAALKVKLEDPQKSSPGHISAAMMNTRTYNSTAAAGSPTCFNTSLGTQALLKSASLKSVLAHSTPTAAPLTDQPTEPANDSTVPEIQREELPVQPETEKPIHPPNQKQQNHQHQQQQQRNHSHQRFRGRNRR